MDFLDADVAFIFIKFY